MIHNDYLNDIESLQILQNDYSIKFNYLISISKIIEFNLDTYYEKSKYKVDIYKNKNNEIIILGYKKIYYDFLNKDECNSINYIVNCSYKINELENSFDNFYKYVYDVLINKKLL